MIYQDSCELLSFKLRNITHTQLDMIKSLSGNQDNITNRILSGYNIITRHAIG
jgi:hypothetical protein